MYNKTDKQIGISAGNKQLIIGLFVAALFLWGPIEPYGMFLRAAYLIILPLLLWFLLRYFGDKSSLDQLANERITRGIAGVIAGLLFVEAGITFTSKFHTECDQEVRARDGTECVGDYVAVEGPDKAEGVFLLIAGGIAFHYSVKKNE